MPAVKEEAVPFGFSFKVQSRDLYLDEYGRSKTVAGDQNVAQGLARMLQTVQGEDFLHPDFGFDLRTFMEYQASYSEVEKIEMLELLLKVTVLRDDRVASVLKTNVERSASQERTYDVNMVVELRDESEVDVATEVSI